MVEIVIRNAELDEVGELIEFWSRAGENAERPADQPGAVERLIERDPEALIVAEIGGQVVGTIIAGWDGWRANLYRLAVAPEHRGRGVGRRILTAAEDQLRGRGAERFCAMVLNDNTLGQSLWAATDYVQQDDWRRWVKAAN